MRARLVVVLALVVLAGLPAGATAPGDYVQPVPGRVVRHFEPPPTPYSAGHRGIDIAAPYGTTVVASSDGTVHFAGQVGGQLFVSIDHPDGIRTTYSFLAAVLVRTGAAVAQGQPIARSGYGHAGVTPDHLHFGALRDGDYIDAEALLVNSVRRNLWRIIRLAPIPEPSAQALPASR